MNKIRKPRNLRKVKISENGSLSCSNPYVNWIAEELPIRVTLDGTFGVQDLEWIILKIKSNKSHKPDSL